MTTAAPRDLGVAAALLVPILAGAAFSLARLAQEGGDVPADQDYVAVAESIEAQGFDPEQDGLVVLPPWSLRPHVQLKRFHPVGGDDIGDLPLHRYARFFVVTEPDHEPHSAALFRKLGAPNVVVEHGPVTLSIFDRQGARAVFDLKARLRDAEVRIARRDGETATACDRWDGSAWKCQGRQNWQRVAAEWQLVSENGQRVIWAHPPPAKEMVEIAWSDVPIGDGLVFRGGHTRDGAKAAKSPVDVEVWVGDEQIAALEFTPQFGMTTTTLDTTAWTGRRERLVVRVYASHGGKQHWGFDGWLFAGGNR